MIKFLKIIFIFIFITSNALAGSDGELELSNKSNSTKDCFEPLNRATFALNQGLDKAIFKPKDIGSACIPWDLPTQGVNLNSIDLFLKEAKRVLSEFFIISSDSLI